ncbi:MAG: hypothetical protein EPO24_04255 [Bacteroidetes bacterium]|nr:MAG: hypothetical protein EPO24_04255 [Bacteroidota bacterium]
MPMNQEQNGKRNRFSHFLMYQFPAFVWAGTIYIISSIPKITLPKINFISVDKAGHIGVFFVLGILVYRAFEPRIKESTLRFKRFLFSFLITISYGISDEIHQSFIPGRFLDKYDMLADGIGALLAGIVVYLFLRRRLKLK